MRKILASYLTPIVLMGIAVSLQAPHARGATAVYNFYAGFTGTTTGTCDSPQCNTEDGCSWITNQYNTYYPGNECTGGLGTNGQGNACVQVLKKCRVQNYYTLSGCAGAISQQNIYWQGGC